MATTFDPYARRNGMSDMTCYDVLHISPDASDQMIQRAYYAQAKRHHPDTNPQDRQLAAARFRLIQEAYEMLRDPTRRQAYDIALRNRRWGPESALNDNLGPHTSDLFASARATLERLMRLMTRTRDIGLGSHHQDTTHHGS